MRRSREKEENEVQISLGRNDDDDDDDEDDETRQRERERERCRWEMRWRKRQREKCPYFRGNFLLLVSRLSILLSLNGGEVDDGGKDNRYYSCPEEARRHFLSLLLCLYRPPFIEPFVYKGVAERCEVNR